MRKSLKQQLLLSVYGSLPNVVRNAVFDEAGFDAESTCRPVRKGSLGGTKTPNSQKYTKKVHTVYKFWPAGAFTV